MLGWGFSIFNMTPEERYKNMGADALLPYRLASWKSGVDGLEWIENLVAEGKAFQLLCDGYPNRYTARAADVLPLIAGNHIKPSSEGGWVFGIDEGEEYVQPPGWLGKIKCYPENIRSCPSDAVLTIDAFDPR
jgi:hypothetical protein